jgi:hypothetical protein
MDTGDTPCVEKSKTKYSCEGQTRRRLVALPTLSSQASILAFLFSRIINLHRLDHTSDESNFMVCCMPASGGTRVR